MEFINAVCWDSACLDWKHVNGTQTLQHHTWSWLYFSLIQHNLQVQRVFFTVSLCALDNTADLNPPCAGVGWLKVFGRIQWRLQAE
jgi:hypothetical protein